MRHRAMSSFSWLVYASYLSTKILSLIGKNNALTNHEKDDIMTMSRVLEFYSMPCSLPLNVLRSCILCTAKSTWLYTWLRFLWTRTALYRRTPITRIDFWQTTSSCGSFYWTLPWINNSLIIRYPVVSSKKRSSEIHREDNLTVTW